MNGINYQAKAEHFAELASRAAYNAATCRAAGLQSDADAWEERAARYDSNAAAYRLSARRAA